MIKLYNVLTEVMSLKCIMPADIKCLNCLIINVFPISPAFGGFTCISVFTIKTTAKIRNTVDDTCSISSKVIKNTNHVM